MIKNILNDIIPISISSLAIGTKIMDWILELHLNSLIITITSLTGFFYLLMKMYDLYLVTKNRKKDMRKKEINK